MNADLNGVKIAVLQRPVAADVVLCGDVFYSATAAANTGRRLDRLLASGARVLVGDPGRHDLPRARLVHPGARLVRAMGDAPGAALHRCGI